AAPVAPGGPRGGLSRGERARLLPLHEDDHPGQAAAGAGAGPRRGVCRPGHGRARPRLGGADDRHRPPGRWRMSVLWEANADLVVVGSGVAGLTAALEARDAGPRVLVVTKDDAGAGSTRWAQGGIAVVLAAGHAPGDSVRRHVTDTLAAAGGLADPAAVATILAEGPAAVAELRRRGAVFDPAPDGAGGLALTREGGHTAFRV